jgi:hypothetical protein
MTSALRHPAPPRHGRLGLKVGGEALVFLALFFPAALAVWGASLGMHVVVLGVLMEIALLGLGSFAWFRPLGGGVCLFVFGCTVGFFALSLVALAPDPRAVLLVLIPTGAVVASGILFWLASGAGSFGAAARTTGPTPRPAPLPVKPVTPEDIARKRLTRAHVVDLVVSTLPSVGLIVLWGAATGHGDINFYYLVGLVFVLWRISSWALVAAFGATLGMRVRGLRADVDGRRPGADWAWSKQGRRFLFLSRNDGLRYRSATPPP